VSPMFAMGAGPHHVRQPFGKHFAPTSYVITKEPTDSDTQTQHLSTTRQVLQRTLISAVNTRRALFTQRANGAGRRRTNEDFQVIRLLPHRLYPHYLPTKHQFFHSGVMGYPVEFWKNV